MKKCTLLLLSIFLISACATNEKLYKWEKYEDSSYNYLKNSDEESIQKLVETFDDIIKNKSKGTRNMVPPGIYADYGFLMLQEGNVIKGKELLMKEVELYPESKIFIDRILKMVSE